MRKVADPGTGEGLVDISHEALIRAWPRVREWLDEDRAGQRVLRRITDTDPRPIREINPDLPAWLPQVIDKLLAKRPADRFASAAETADVDDATQDLGRLQVVVGDVTRQLIHDQVNAFAAGLKHPGEISARHIVRRTGEQEVKLLINLLPFVKPGSLLAAMHGEADWPHNVYRVYWPQSSSQTWQLQAA